MKRLSILCAMVCAGFCSAVVAGPNQTDALTPIGSQSSLPFSVSIEQMNFQLPKGSHSGVLGVTQGQWVIFGGRLNGLHGFGANPFPADKQNLIVYVVNPATGVVSSRSLADPGSGLSQAQIDTLSVTSPQFYQEAETLYISGGYGVDTASGNFGTKPVLTAVYLPGIVQWVQNPGNSSYTFAKNITQLTNSVFQVTGGRMQKSGNSVQLIFGQDFEGIYTPGSNGNYIQQVRRFQLTSTNGQLAVNIMSPLPSTPDPNYRRRDLSIVPVLMNNNGLLKEATVAFGGVFTLAGGVWTVPVVIDTDGKPTMADPNAANTFKQGMQEYIGAHAGLYSRKYQSMYAVFFGGVSYGYFVGGVFTVDPEDPFINQVTTVQIDKNGNFSQYLMNNEYPTILSTTTNAGNPLLFGAGAFFVPAHTIQHYANGVLNLDSIRSATVIGYIVGGIASTVPNTASDADSWASSYVFRVTLTPK